MSHSAAAPSSSDEAPVPPPLQPIPGSYGWPVVGPFMDRLDYFWFQGQDKFFRNRMEKYKSTVFRTNVPPCFPFFAGVNPNVVALLDCKSYAHLFDSEIVEKTNTLLGEYMPSLGFTGNLRVFAYQDSLEPKHVQLKRYTMAIMKRGTKVWAPELLANLDEMWTTLETDVSSKGSASVVDPLERGLFKLLIKSYVGADVDEPAPGIAESGLRTIKTWFALQNAPRAGTNMVQQPFQEIFLHSFTYPSFLVRRGYNKLANFITTQGQDVVQLGVTEYGLTKEEALHNLLFLVAMNSFNGLRGFLFKLFGRLLALSTEIQENLRLEARQIQGPDLTFDSVKQAPLTQSFVYEVLRFETVSAYQFGRARRDFRLSCSNGASYEVKKGELMMGYMPLVMRDPAMFDDPERFKPDRFVGEQGAELLNYLYWSHGPQTGSPGGWNKQCAGKDYVPVTGVLFVAHLFRRFDSVSGVGSTVTAFVKAK